MPCKNEIDFEYLLPEGITPWTHAYIKGTAKVLEEVMKYLTYP